MKNIATYDRENIRPVAKAFKLEVLAQKQSLLGQAKYVFLSLPLGIRQ